MWNCECYNAQYREAKEFGMLDEVPKAINAPDPNAPKTAAELRTFIDGLTKKVVKTMPKPKPQDWDKGHAPFVEPIDETKTTDDEDEVPF